ncbi:MAG: hypothetical protein JRH12_13160 [Deltaproteobacteria bacterium]|nr:hypothetical protein [Deltaproteobacteria bacterium]
MPTKVIRYCFRMPDNSREDFRFELNAENLEFRGNLTEGLPPWTKLEFHQCANCPLDAAAHPHCPLAINIYNIVQRLDGLNSYDEITVEVVTKQRWIAQRTTAQLAISSMMGLVIAACGCPHTAFFKPMAWFHLPLASKEETVFRATSFYMLAQYYCQKEGRAADFEFEGLAKIYQNMQTVNCAIARRLRVATANDSSVNAIVILDSFAQIVPFAIEESLEELRYLFSPSFSGRQSRPSS